MRCVRNCGKQKEKRHSDSGTLHEMNYNDFFKDYASYHLIHLFHTQRRLSLLVSKARQTTGCELWKWEGRVSRTSVKLTDIPVLS